MTTEERRDRRRQRAKNRQLVQHGEFVGGARGYGGGLAAGALAGGALGGKKGAALGAVAGAVTGEARGAQLGRRKAMRHPDYKVVGPVVKSAFGVEHIAKFGAPAAVGALGAPPADVKNKKVLVGQNAPAMVTASAPGGVNKVKAKLAPLTQTPTVS